MNPSGGRAIQFSELEALKKDLLTAETQRTQRGHRVDSFLCALSVFSVSLR